MNPIHFQFLPSSSIFRLLRIVERNLGTNSSRAFLALLSKMGSQFFACTFTFKIGTCNESRVADMCVYDNVSSAVT